MKKILISAIVVATALCSCNNDTDIDLFSSQLSDQGVGTLANTGKFINWLEFAWQPVEGVYQYGYALSDPNGKAVRQGITKQTTIKFERLEVDCAYTLQIEAYGQNGVPTQRFETTAKTDPILQLASVDAESFGLSTDEGPISISWTAVENAEYYDYELLSSEGNSLVLGSVDTNNLEFSSLPGGDYILLVYANSYSEAYTVSEPARFEFNVEASIAGLLYSAQGQIINYDYWDDAGFDGRITFDGQINVDVFEDYILINGWLGDNEQCLKVTFDASQNVTSVTPIDNGIEGKTYTKGYASFYTYSNMYYYTDLYIAKNYDFAYADNQGGFVRLSGYFYDMDQVDYWLYYNIEWTK